MGSLLQSLSDLRTNLCGLAGKSSSGFDRTGPYRAQFVLQCVSDLRTSLRARGSDLIVRMGRPEEELPRLARATGATAMYAHREVTREDWGLEQTVSAKLKVRIRGGSGHRCLLSVFLLTGLGDASLVPISR